MKRAFLFGYGNHGKPIAKGLSADGFYVVVIEGEEKKQQQAVEDGFADTYLIDVTNDEHLKKLDIQTQDQLVCVMDDEHLNVFLTLSLRSLFETNTILAISDSIHTTRKLQMAGADKVIDLYEVSANRIHNILKRPVATKLLEGFINDKHQIGFREIMIPEGSCLDGMMTDEYRFEEHKVLLVGMIDRELSNNFIFVTTGINHKLDSGDTIVCIGNEENLGAFEKHIYSSTKDAN
ncbi:MAG: TrkA family potassium uptake protein [Campylobacterales bacterium]|nr:TrkA family potassium uptake protein [Campylobacterales bacterium]